MRSEAQWRTRVREAVAQGGAHDELTHEFRTLRPPAAADECILILREGAGDERFEAVLLLYDLTRAEHLALVPELLADRDPRIAVMGAAVVQDFALNGHDDLEPLVELLETHADPDVRRVGVQVRAALVGVPQGSLEMFDTLPLTYPEIGGSLLAELPAGYRHLGGTRVIGRGRADFERAARDLLSWQVQRRAGLRVTAQTPAVTAGAYLLLGIGVGPLRVSAPAQVVRVVDEERRQGFAYGTLLGHPERGEESFVLTHGADESVVFTVRAFSRPATRLARLGGPVTPLLQDLATRRYLRALVQKV